MRFRVLGSLEVIHEGERVPLSGMRAKALAVLLLEPGRWVPAQRFIDVLWDDEPPSTAVRQVQNTLAALRRQLAEHGGDPIERSGLGYRLDSDDIDLIRFENGRTAAREASAAGDAASAAAELERALAHWRGSPLADLSGDRLEAAAARLERERLAALEALNDVELALGRNESVAVRARELLDADPYRQRTAAQLIRALGARGRGVEALAVYADIRTRLIEDLGLDPDPELREAQRCVLDSEPGTARPRARQAAVPAQLPAALGGFCGREADLKELDDLLDSPSDALRIALVSGPGGVGKTALALEWAQQVRDRFPDGQLYVDLRGFHPGGVALDAAEALRGFLTALGIGAADVPAAVGARTDLFRSLVADRRMLIVLDNAADAGQVLPLLPGSRHCTVLVTSRRLMPGLVARHGANQLRLKVFDRPWSREVLERRLGAERAAAEPEAVDRILDACAGLPLALAVAAARVASEPRFPLRAFAERLGETDGALDALETGDPVGDVRAVFTWSYEALSADAARLFRLTGLHTGPEFTAAAAASLLASSPRRARELLRELTGAHLLTERRPGRFAAHDLLAAYARETLDDEEPGAAVAATRRLLDHYTRSSYDASSLIDRFREPLPMPEAGPGAVIESFDGPEAAMAWVLTEAQTLGGTVERAEAVGLDEHATALAWSIAVVLHRNGDWDIGLATQRCALRAAARLGDHRHQAAAHVHTAMFLLSGDDLESAERHLRLARDLCDPERDRRLLARVDHRIAVVLDQAGRFTEALDHCTEAHRLFTEAGDDNGRANALNGIGWLQARLGRYDEAVDHCERSLALSRSIGSRGAESQVLDSLGYVRLRQGRHLDAIEYFERSLEISRSIGLRINEAQVNENIGDAYRELGRPEPARRHWRRSLEIFEEMRERRADRLCAKLAELDGAGT